MLTAAGAVAVKTPRVNNRRVNPDSMRGSAFPRRSCRRPPRTTQIDEVLPLLYLHELPTSDFCPALAQFLYRLLAVDADDHPSKQPAAGQCPRVLPP